MSHENQLAVPQKVRAYSQLATLLGMEVPAMLDTIKAQCFKCPASQVSDAQLAAFVSIAAEMQVNPLLPGMLYAYPGTSGQITPIMGPDGVFKKLSERQDVDTWETKVFPEDPALPPTHAITNIWRKGHEKPLSYTAYFSEWKINSNPNWNSRPRHMLQIRALKQCARQIIHGIPFDEDERHIMGEINVTHTTDPATSDKLGEPVGDPTNVGETTAKRRGRPPGRSATGAAAVVDTEPATVTEAKTIDVHATATPETDPAKAEGSKPAAPADKPAPVTSIEPIKPVTSLIHGEKKSFAGVNVVEIVAQNFGTAEKPRLAVKATVEGPFTGLVYDTRLGSAAWVDERDPAKGVKANPPWQLDHPINLTLVGKSRPDGTIANVVETAELSTDSAKETGELP